MRMGILLFYLMSSLVFCTEEQKGLNSFTIHTEHKYKKLIENTTWIVPPTALRAYKYEAGSVQKVLDQTVWVINSFHDGYFFGDSYTAINAAPASHMNLVGSITSYGDVYITFFQLQESCSLQTL